METTLRPLALGEILDRTAQLYRENFVLLAGISAVYAGALLVLNLLQLGIAELLRLQHIRVPWVTFLFLLFVVPLMIVLAGATVAANNRAVSWVHLGEPATIRGAYRGILPHLGRYLWLMTIVAVIVYLPFVLLYGSYFLMLFFYVGPQGGMLAHPGAAANPQATLVFGIATLALVLLSLPTAVYAVLMALRYSLAVPASVVENLPARRALRRSVELSKGARGRIFVLGLLIVAIQFGLVGITQIFFVVAAFKLHGRLPVWALALQQVVGFLTNSFIGPLYATGFALFYYDQRVRKEGFDIEWMMQAAGLTSPETGFPPPASESEPAEARWPPPDTLGPASSNAESAPLADVPQTNPPDEGNPHA